MKKVATEGIVKATIDILYNGAMGWNWREHKKMYIVWTRVLARTPSLMG